jgi:fluoride ion exporter CrcB/FEX
MTLHDLSPDNKFEHTLPNGFGAAAILAAGIGCFSLGILTVAGDASKSFARHLILYTRTGPLSGVTTAAIAIWLLAWLVLWLRWRTREVALRPVLVLAFVLLALSLLLTFPPIIELF